MWNSTFKNKPRKPLKRTPLRKVSLNKVKKPKAHNTSWWRKKCDSLLQDIMREKYKFCEVCGGKNEVAHHVVTKALSSFLRYNLANLAHICKRCHFALHIQSDSSILAKLIEIRGKEWYAELEKQRRLPQQTGVKYYQQVYDDLLTLQKSSNSL